MRFVIHGGISPDIAAALQRHGHVAHSMDELLADQGETPADSRTPQSRAAPPVSSELFAALAQHQWFLLTADAALVHCIFDEKIIYAGIVVLLIDAPDAATQSAAIDRLFARYKRLTPKRLYTVTPNRVKIRQLPGSID